MVDFYKCAGESWWIWEKLSSSLKLPYLKSILRKDANSLFIAIDELRRNQFTVALNKIINLAGIVWDQSNKYRIDLLSAYAVMCCTKNWLSK